ncbi:hypothetical protein ACLQ2E_21815 [Streptomyces lavendulocolor]
MTDDETVRDDAGQEQPNKAAGACVLVIVGGGALYGLVNAVPESAYVMVGILGTVGVQRARTWRDRRGDAVPEDGPAEDAGEEPEEPVDITEHLWELSGGGESGVLLTQLQKAAALPDTRTVRNLLHAADVRVRAGVRTPAGNGPGVHRVDIPAASPVDDDTPGDGCCCRSDANANANNGTPPGPGEGLRVEPIESSGGRIVRDPATAAQFEKTHTH